MMKCFLWFSKASILSYFLYILSRCIIITKVMIINEIWCFLQFLKSLIIQYVISQGNERMFDWHRNRIRKWTYAKRLTKFLLAYCSQLSPQALHLYFQLPISLIRYLRYLASVSFLWSVILIIITFLFGKLENLAFSPITSTKSLYLRRILRQIVSSNVSSGLKSKKRDDCRAGREIIEA